MNYAVVSYDGCNGCEGEDDDDDSHDEEHPVALYHGILLDELDVLVARFVYLRQFHCRLLLVTQVEAVLEAEDSVVVAVGTIVISKLLRCCQSVAEHFVDEECVDGVLVFI